MSDSDEPAGGRTVAKISQTGLWLTLYSAALSGLCASRDNDTMGAEGLAKDAADVADAAVSLVTERFELLNLAKKKEEEEASK